MKKILLFVFFVLIISCSEEQDMYIIDDEHDSTSEQDTALLKELEFRKIQDSILKNYSGAIKLINQIDSELSQLSNAPQSQESYNLEMEILQKIDYLSFQLKSRNEEISKLEKRLKSLGKENKTLMEKIQTMEVIIAEKDKIIENQILRIQTLEIELEQIRNERDFAVIEKQNIESIAKETEREKNTAYFVVANEKKLKSDEIIRMEGEGFLGIGGRYVPVADADLNLFTKIDILKDTLIPMPSNFKEFDIVSTHNRKLLEKVSSSSGGDYLKVLSPEIFWKTDKMLIIIIE